MCFIRKTVNTFGNSVQISSFCDSFDPFPTHLILIRTHTSASANEVAEEDKGVWWKQGLKCRCEENLIIASCTSGFMGREKKKKSKTKPELLFFDSMWATWY